MKRTRLDGKIECKTLTLISKYDCEGEVIGSRPRGICVDNKLTQSEHSDFLEQKVDFISIVMNTSIFCFLLLYCTKYLKEGLIFTHIIKLSVNFYDRK